MAYDLVIRNGKIVDGSALPGFHGDVFVNGGCIVEIGRVSSDARLLRKFLGSLWLRTDL